MLLVDTELKVSAIHGLGCFTREPIRAGQRIWQHDDRIDVRIPQGEIAAMPTAIQRHLEIYTYPEIIDGVVYWVLSADNAKHMNHSDTPNTHSPDMVHYAALRDIAAGEELTCDYREFDVAHVARITHTNGLAGG